MSGVRFTPGERLRSAKLNRLVTTAEAPSDGRPYVRLGNAWAPLRDPIQAAMSDETTALTAGTGRLTLRVLRARAIIGVRANLKTASSSGVVTVDINRNGASILSTPITIDANERTSVTAAVPAVLSATTLADDDELSFDIDTAGTGAVGLKVTLDTEYLS